MHLSDLRSNRLNKIATAVFLLNVQLSDSLSYATDAVSPQSAPDCSLTKIDQGHIEIHYGQKYIHIIGWTHLDPTSDEGTKLGQIIVNATTHSLSDCNQALLDIRNGIVEHAAALKSSAEATVQLSRANFKHNISIIGTEFTPEEQSHEEATFIELDKELNWIGRTCPTSLPLIAKMRTIIPGPDWLFAHSLPQAPKIIGLESAELRKQTEDDIKIMQAASLDSNEMKLNPTAADAYAKIGAAIARGGKISQNDVDEFLKKQPASAQKDSFLRFLKAFMDMFDQVKARNTAIADQLKKQSGNIAMLIGAEHVDDLASQVTRLCLNDSAVKQQSAASAWDASPASPKSTSGIR